MPSYKTDIADDRFGSVAFHSSVIVPYFSSVNNIWRWKQEGPYAWLISPEPSFAEWKRGKEANLSVMKPLSDTISHSSVIVPYFSSVSNIWRWKQEDPYARLVSPEPSFAEWKGGKEANLSVVKPLSDMASASFQ